MKTPTFSLFRTSHVIVLSLFPLLFASSQATGKNLTKRVGKEWREMSEELKDTWIKKAQLNKGFFCPRFVYTILISAAQLTGPPLHLLSRTCAAIHRELIDPLWTLGDQARRQEGRKNDGKTAGRQHVHKSARGKGQNGQIGQRLRNFKL